MVGFNRSKKKSKANTFKEIAEHFQDLVKRPDCFLKPQPESIDSIQQLIQQTYGVCISSDDANKGDILPELVLANMDEEQIWQQLEMRNNFMVAQLLKQTAQLTAMREQHLGIELDDDDYLKEEENDQSDTEKSIDDEGSHSRVDASDINERSPEIKVKKNKTVLAKIGRNSVVDDAFFKLDEMKQFLEQEDAKEMRKHKNKKLVEDTESIDHFAENFGIFDDSDDDKANANYADFFEVDDELKREALKNPKVVETDFFAESDSDIDKGAKPIEEDATELDKNDSEEQPQDDAVSEIDEADFVALSGLQPASESDSDDDKNSENADEDENSDQHEPSSVLPQSSNEMREARLIQRIRDYEDVVLGEKPWQLKGEVQGVNRPQNSLLEEILEFDSTTRPSAPITEEQNQTIEDIIKQRIRDKAWDDVARTVRPIHTPQEYRKQLVLDQEKSKQSLAQIYEQQYQREVDKLNPNRDEDDRTSLAPEPKEYQEIKRAMRTLFLKLDALSNFHFTPKPIAPEAKIVTNTPAVHMEEVAPLAVSDAKLLAPEEVFRGPKHSPLGKTERTRTDKNRERRKKKQKQRAINNATEVREQQRAKEGKLPTKREANANLLKTIIKSRNVQKITTTNDQGALKSSKAFFNKLQDTTASTAETARLKRPKEPLKVNAKKLKL